MGAPIQGIACIMVMLVISLPGNILQCLAHFLLPRKISRIVSNTVYLFQTWGLLVSCDYFTNLELVFYGDELPEEESAVIISNHLGAEFIHFAQIAYRYKMITGTRFVQKEALKYVPVNWTCYFQEHCFIKRGEGAAAVKDTLARFDHLMSSLTEDCLPSWLVIFPEGTWVGGPQEQAILDRSQAFAKKSGLPVLERVLTPRAAGFAAAVQSAIDARNSAAEKGNLKTATNAVYDFTFAYDEPTIPTLLGKEMPPSVLHMCNGAKGAFCPKKLHIHVRRLPLDPADKASDPLLLSDPATWVQQSFETKEKILGQFSKDGEFPGGKFDAAPSPSGTAAMWIKNVAMNLCWVLGSWFALWSLSPIALCIYLGSVLLLCSVVAANVSWDEGVPIHISRDDKVVNAAAGTDKTK